MVPESCVRTVLAAMKARAAALIDGRAGPPFREYLLHRRHWAASGVRVGRVGDEAPPLPFVALVPKEIGARERQQFLQVLQERQLEATVLVWEADGTVSSGGQRLEDPGAPERDVTLRLLGRGQRGNPEDELCLPGCGLPCRVQARLPSNPSAAVVYVEGDHPTDRLPEGQWFRVPERDRTVTLLIDVEPSAAGEDRWVVRTEDGKECPAIPPPSPVPLARLIVVFDQTCPDADQWQRARQLVKGRAVTPKRAPADDAYRDQGLAKAVVEAGLDLGELNAAIRRGLARGLCEAIGSSTMRVHLLGFADVAGQGLVTPPGLNLPDQAVAPVTAALEVSRIAAQLDRLRYAPGLDLWDPLDEALDRATQVARGDRTVAILVVGNSPPHMPHPADHPFWRVIDRRLGVPSGFRRCGYDSAAPGRPPCDFLTVLAEIERVGLRVGYLFLTGHQTEGESGRRFQRVQELIRDALASCLPLAEADAEEEAVAQGVLQAVRFLQAEVSRVVLSSVEVP